MSDKALRKGTIVFSQGEAGDSMYFVRWGKVGLYTDYKTFGQKKVAELATGDYFGELSLIDGEDRDVTAVVLENDTQLDCISPDGFGQFLLDNPSKVYLIIERLCGRLRQADRDYLDVCRSVSDAVGGETDVVDEASDYRFAQHDQLREIHDQQAATSAANA